MKDYSESDLEPTLCFSNWKPSESGFIYIYLYVIEELLIILGNQKINKFVFLSTDPELVDNKTSINSERT